MSSLRSTFLVVLPVLYSLASGASFESAAVAPAAPLAGLEPTYGQAAAGVVALTRSGLAIAGDSILYSIYSIHGVALKFVEGNPDPRVSFIDPLPGLVNFFTSSDPRNWATGFRSYETVHLTEVWRGVDARYTISAAEGLVLTLVFRPGVDTAIAQFEFTKISSLSLLSDGSLRARLGPFRTDPELVFRTPEAWQQFGSSRVATSARFELKGTGTFALHVEGRDASLPLAITLRLPFPTTFTRGQPRHFVRDARGNTFAVDFAAESPAKELACGSQIGIPIPCTDVIVYKYRPDGQLAFLTYLSGVHREVAHFVGLGDGGSLIVAGTTESRDFPSTRDSFQPEHAGPAPTRPPSSGQIAGDYFATRLDPETGVLLSSTFLGGPNPDEMGEAALGSDGSLYFIPKWLTATSAAMPISPGALQTRCLGADSCRNGYAARLSPNLARLLYGTYLPGTPQATAKLHSDGSVYYAGSNGPGFEPTATAWQRRPLDDQDAIIARLDPQGTRLLFGTYIGTPKIDGILRMAVAPDGSVWAGVASYLQCCINIENRLVHLDARGERLLADRNIDVGDIAVDREGNLIATAVGTFPVSPDAPLANSCTNWGGAYLKLRPDGEQIFATYLPAGTSYDFDGTSDLGLPVLRTYGNYRFGFATFQVIEGKSMGVFTGCILDSASFVNSNPVSPGALVTLFGSRMGPREGVMFQLKDGRYQHRLVALKC